MKTVMREKRAFVRAYMCAQVRRGVCVNSHPQEQGAQLTGCKSRRLLVNQGEQHDT